RAAQPAAAEQGDDAPHEQEALVQLSLIHVYVTSFHCARSLVHAFHVSVSRLAQKLCGSVRAVLLSYQRLQLGLGRLVLCLCKRKRRLCRLLSHARLVEALPRV